MKFNVIIADPPFRFSDALKMSDIRRSAQSNYNTMSLDEICSLPVHEITNEKASILALWCPSSMLADGLKIMKSWKFQMKQTVVWVKTKKSINSFDLEQSTSTGMGRYFRNSHEIALIGIRGKIPSEVKNHSQKTVLFGNNIRHSQKPDTLHERLEIMFPQFKSKLELFGRSNRSGWTVIGNEAPDCVGEDINTSIQRLIAK